MVTSLVAFPLCHKALAVQQVTLHSQCNEIQFIYLNTGKQKDVCPV